MDYEKTYESPFLNWRLFIIVIICIVIVTWQVYPIYQKSVIEKNNQIMATKNESKVIEIQYITVMVTPTIDGKLYFASEYEEGIRKIGREFSFRKDNVSGLKDLVVHTNVYDYREFNFYHWFNPSDGKYYREYPSTSAKKFIFIFTYIYLDDVMGDDTRFYIPNEKAYNLQVRNRIYEPIIIPKQLRLRELEYVPTSNNDEYIQYYGQMRIYKGELEYANSAGEVSADLSYLKGGLSNKVDGYLIFEVDKNDKIEDMQINVNYYGLGTSSWKLKT